MEAQVWKKDKRFGNDNPGTYWFGETNYMVTGSGKQWFAYEGYCERLISVEESRANAGFAIEYEMMRKAFSNFSGRKLDVLERALKSIDLTEEGGGKEWARRELLMILKGSSPAFGTREEKN